MTSDHAALTYAARNEAALCTIVSIDGSFSRRCGAQLAVGRDGTLAGDLADNCLNAELANQAEEAFATGESRILRYGKGSPFIDFRLPCGAGLDILIEPQPDRAALNACLKALDNRQPATLPLPLPQGTNAPLLSERRYMPPLRLLVLGAGQECAEMVKLAQAQGMSVEWREAGNGLSLNKVPTDLEADLWTAVLLLFHDHEWEFALLDWALTTDAFYIGAQGGQPARQARLLRLGDAGHDEQALSRITSPVGLIPRARDSAVLALSVMAEIVGVYETLHPHP